MISSSIIKAASESDIHPFNEDRYINVYRLNQCYGGPEEGGWYWTSWECLVSVEIDGLSKYKRKVLFSLLREQYPHGQDMPLEESWQYQGDDHDVRVESRKAQLETREIPRYE